MKENKFRGKKYINKYTAGEKTEKVGKWIYGSSIENPDYKGNICIKTETGFWQKVIPETVRRIHK